MPIRLHRLIQKIEGQTVPALLSSLEDLAKISSRK
jgi:hypothetical protein